MKQKVRIERRRWLCVYSVLYFVAINGVEVGSIMPKRDLRQGKPIWARTCLYFVSKDCRLYFIRLREIVSSMVLVALSHLLFDYDNFFFFWIDEWNVAILRESLWLMKKLRVKRLIFKSQVFSLARIDLLIGEVIFHLGLYFICVSISHPLDHRHYLDLPSLIGQSKKRVFSFSEG